MNVLLVTTDQQRAETIGAYGSPLGATPNLDRLAAAGVGFCRTLGPLLRGEARHRELLALLDEFANQDARRLPSTGSLG
jgi:hypothetical protein